MNLSCAYVSGMHAFHFSIVRHCNQICVDPNDAFTLPEKFCLFGRNTNWN